MKTVSVPIGTAIPGRAALAVSSTNSSNSSCPTETSTSNSDSNSSSSSGSGAGSGSSSSRETAIGAGVGVPLGVIALASLAWAFWERRGRIQALKQTTAGSETGQQYQQMAYRSPPVELQGPEVELSGSPAATEIGSEGYPKPHSSAVS